MDFKSTCVLISFLSLAAGVFKGWLDYQALSAEAPPPLEPPSPTEPAEPPGTRPRESGDVPLAEGGDARAPGGASRGSERAGEPAPDPSRSDEPSAADRAALREVEQLIAAQQFQAAAERARELARAAPRALENAARRLEARAVLFDKLVPPSGSGTERFQRVLLSNRSELLASKIEESVDAYKLHLESGAYTEVAREDVLEVAEADPQLVRKTRAQEVAREVARLTDPKELYRRGVREYYRSGLRGEGFRLLESILSRSDGKEVLALVEGDREELGRYWDLAQESEPPPARAESSPVRPEREPRRPAGDPVSVASILAIVGDAEKLYREAARIEGREGDLRRARDLLGGAQDMLERLPDADSDEAHQLRARISQLVGDVNKSLPLFDS